MHTHPRLMTSLAATVLLASAFAPPALAGTGDGTVQSITKIQDNGPDSVRFNIVIMGDGYTAAEMPAYEARAQEVVNAFNAELTYGACGGAVNFYRVNIASDQSGTDKPAPCYTSPVSRDTYLDTHYCASNIQRCIWSTDTGLVMSTAAAATPNWHYVVVLVNDAEHGGCAGGGLTFNSTGSGFESTVMHELGHALGGLADEYSYGGADTYTGGEPGAPNLTIETDRGAVKWFDLIESTTPFPTWNRTDCSTSAELPPPALEGRVGSFEGGAYHRCGIYHPERSCLMRVLHTEFCEVCNRQVRKVLANHLANANVAITPWGYYQTPKVHPYWQTPDIWVDNDLNGTQDPNEPLIGKSDNRLFARITNQGNLTSGPFQVRFSYVPFTGVIDLANSQPIATVTRPALTAGGGDVVEVAWPLDAIPPQFAGIDHFCVIVEILADECTTADNRAQNNFGSVQTLGPLPARLPFYIVNILDQRATGAVEIEPIPPRPGWHIGANVPDLRRIPLEPGETKKIVLDFHYQAARDDDLEVAAPEIGEGVEQDFDVTYRLEGQVLGGVSSRVHVLPRPPRHFSLSLHLGTALPQGDFDLLYDEGPSAVLDVGYRFSPRFSLVGLLGRYEFGLASNGPDLELWSASLDLKWDLFTGKVRPFVQAGAGIYYPDSGSSEPGYNVGAGVDFEIASAWDLEIGASHHTVPAPEPDVEFLDVAVGVIFRY